MESGNWGKQAAPSERVRSYEDLECFRRAMALVRPIHDLVQSFPDFEKYDLAQQMRRASKSVPVNIAEGFSRRTSPKDYRLFLSHALGSANEVLVQLQIALNLDYVVPSQVSHLQEEYSIVARQFNRLGASWRSDGHQLQTPKSKI